MLTKLQLVNYGHYLMVSVEMHTRRCVAASEWCPPNTLQEVNARSRHRQARVAAAGKNSSELCERLLRCPVAQSEWTGFILNIDSFAQCMRCAPSAHLGPCRQGPARGNCKAEPILNGLLACWAMPAKAS
jgi:hypothetical protein